MTARLIHGISIIALLLSSIGLAQDRPTPRAGGFEPFQRDTASTSPIRYSIEEQMTAVEQRYKEIDEDELKEAPKRDFQVEVKPTEKIQLFRADPKLLENKFVAILVVSGGGTLDNLFRELERREERIHPFFKTIVEQCPEGHRPEQRQVEFLLSPASQQNLRRIGLPEFRQDTFILHVYAPSAEEAEARTRAIVQLLDCGYFRPAQRQYLDKGREYLKEAQQSHAEYRRLGDQIRAEEAKLAKPSEITPDILNQLKAQKVMVAVELAGLIARVKACDEMLKEPRRLEVSTLQSVSDMKVKAEIERIGIKEKLDQINAFIAEGNEREASQAAVAKMKSTQLVLQRSIASRARAADNSANSILEWAPPPLRGNVITIAPIEWTN